MMTTNGTTNGLHADADADIDLLYAWAPPQAPPQALPEAAFSLTLKGTLDGHEALFTIRGQTPAEFQRNLASVRGILDAATPSATPPAGEMPRCPEHGNFLRKGKRGWYCPQKLVDGTYCPHTAK
jgi:hypothetical protein